MFIHLGQNSIISGRKLIGIFNHDTLVLSEENTWITKRLDMGVRTVAIDRKSRLFTSHVSPFTVIKRTSLDRNFVWRKRDDKELQRR